MYGDLVQAFEHSYSVSNLLQYLKDYQTSKLQSNPASLNQMRAKRYLASRILSGTHQVTGNLQILRAQLKPLLYSLVHRAVHQLQNVSSHKQRAYSHSANSASSDEEVYNGIKEEYLYSDENKHAIIVKYCKHRINGNKSFWSQKIQKLNTKLHKKYVEGNGYGVFDEDMFDLDTLSIDKFQLPLFKEFVGFFFVNTDHEQFHKIIDSNNNIDG